MKIAILGAGAMGSLFGGFLAQSGQAVMLIDVARDAVDAINTRGLRLDEGPDDTRTIAVPATTDPGAVGPVDLVIVFVKCYHTEAAVRGAAPLLGPETAVLSLQNGWGNAPRIAALVGGERVLAGVTYHSATVLGPGHVHHAGRGATFIGELSGETTERLARIVEAVSTAGFAVTPSSDVRREIWAKLALNVCTLPTAALLRFTASELVEHDGTVDLMRGLLREVCAVAHAQGIALDEAERWEAITGLLRRAVGAKASMLQDVEHRRQTEIDVINGAIVAAGRERQIPTPLNDAMVWLVKSLHETFV